MVGLAKIFSTFSAAGRNGFNISLAFKRSATREARRIFASSGFSFATDQGFVSSIRLLTAWIFSQA